MSIVHHTTLNPLRSTSLIVDKNNFCFPPLGTGGKPLVEKPKSIGQVSRVNRKFFFAEPSPHFAARHHPTRLAETQLLICRMPYLLTNGLTGTPLCAIGLAECSIAVHLTLQLFQTKQNGECVNGDGEWFEQVNGVSENLPGRCSTM